MHAASVILLTWAMIGAACLVSPVGTTALGGVLAVLVAVVGLPHGAADHRFARPRLEPIFGPAWAGLFLVGYVAIAAAVVVGWFLAPAATIVVFFLTSAWHFGQEEPRLLVGPPVLQPIFRFARGGLVIWTPMVFQADEVVRILSVTAPAGLGSDIQLAARALTACSWPLLVIAAVAWGLQGLAAIQGRGRRRRILLVDNAMTLTFAVVFAVASPIVGFLLYFCAWHSARGLRRLRRELGESWSQLAASLAPLTVATIALVAVMTGVVLRTPSWNDTLIRATFIGLSAVAVPHLLLHGAGPFIEKVATQRTTRTLQLGSPA